jgi:thioredoxin reductase (NADPH)
MALTWEVENYPGVEKISGYELGQLMERQARNFGLEIRSLEVTGVATDGPLHRVSTTERAPAAPRDRGRRAQQPPGVPGRPS